MSLTFHLIPHTHWDREWYLPRAGFEARLCSFLDGLLGLLEREASLRFHLDGQTVLIEDFLAVQDPDLRTPAAARIRQLVAAGRLGLGPWYVLADELIPSGESLVRNLLFGAADARRFGGGVPVLYSPDAFGHPDVLPSLAGEFGLPFAVLWRGLGTPTGTDRDLYRWKGPDGRSVLVYHLPRQGYEIGSNLVGPEAALADRWFSVRDPLVARAQSRQIAVPVGADHHAADPELGLLVSRLQALEPGALVRMSSLAEFFAAVVAERPALAEIEGELRSSPGYTWSLQGVTATRSRQKRIHAIAELALSRVAEPLGALLIAASGAGAHHAVVRAAWRRLIQSQFHDTIAGTVDDSVAREQAVRLESVRVAAREVTRATLAMVAGHDFDRARDYPERQVPTLVLWNPVARERSEVVTAEITAFRRDVLVGPPTGALPRTGAAFRSGHFRAPDGTVVPWQVLRVRPGVERIDAPRHYPDQDEVDRVFVAFRPPPLGGCSGITLAVKPGNRTLRAGRPVTVRGPRLAAGGLTVRLDPDGTAEVVDRRSAMGLAGLFSLRAELDRGDTYTPAVDPAGGVARALAGRSEAMASGPFVGALATPWIIRGPGGVVRGRRVIELRLDSPLVRVRFDLENEGSGQRVRLLLPTGIRGKILAGGPFGQSKRGPVRPDPGAAGERPVPTAVAQRFVAVAGRKAGIAVFAPGAFEYEWTASGDLIITLLRSVGELSRADLVERPGHAGWPVPTPLALELGTHRIELAVALVGPDSIDRPAAFVRLWEAAFLPPVALWFRDFVGQHRLADGITLEGDDLSFEALKPAEDGDGLILRAVNRSERAGRGRWRLPWSPAGAVRVRADETSEGSLERDDDPTQVAFAYGPREIVSIRIRPPGPA